MKLGSVAPVPGLVEFIFEDPEPSPSTCVFPVTPSLGPPPPHPAAEPDEYVSARMTDTDHPSAPSPELAEPVRAHLGEKLKEFYGSILAEPVPDRLTALLDALERQERAAAAASAKGGHE